MQVSSGAWWNTTTVAAEGGDREGPGSSTASKHLQIQHSILPPAVENSTSVLSLLQPLPLICSNTLTCLTSTNHWLTSINAVYRHTQCQIVLASCQTHQWFWNALLLPTCSVLDLDCTLLPWYSYLPTCLTSTHSCPGNPTCFLSLTVSNMTSCGPSLMDCCLHSSLGPSQWRSQKQLPPSLIHHHSSGSLQHAALLLLFPLTCSRFLGLRSWVVRQINVTQTNWLAVDYSIDFCTRASGITLPFARSVIMAWQTMWRTIWYRSSLRSIPQLCLYYQGTGFWMSTKSQSLPAVGGDPGELYSPELSPASTTPVPGRIASGWTPDPGHLYWLRGLDTCIMDKDYFVNWIWRRYQYQTWSLLKPWIVTLWKLSLSRLPHYSFRSCTHPIYHSLCGTPGTAFTIWQWTSIHYLSIHHLHLHRRKVKDGSLRSCILIIVD